ncbi:DUF305 domain-containing protein [Gilvimarinus sp. F26214L]|uniref:DUF305 domain-containing protein n=1 Tax=Gilvimarinus sp. DZF01 TaxID=3461371 RepID=UPI00404684F4
MSYWRFAAMIATSTGVMFGLMYLNTYAFEHVMWSETRFWMAFVMGATMAVIMLSYMLNMYQSKPVNLGIYVGSIIVFGGALWLVRSQATIDQVEYMEAMVPHHSIAIMTSERAQIEDPRVRKLADEIIEAQRREISEMKYLVAVLSENDGGNPQMMEAPLPEVVPPEEALRSPNLAETDPASMDEAEIEKVIPRGPSCGFAYTAEGKPIFKTGLTEATAVAVVKIHGRLVQLRSEAVASFEELINGGSFHAGPIRVTVGPVRGKSPEELDGSRRWPANMMFDLEQGLKVGYRGWYTCEQ